MLKIIVLLIIVVPIIIYYKGKKGRELFRESVNLESEEKFEAACYKYAESAREGTKKKICLKKIGELSEKYGPFNFVKVEKNNRDKFDCDSCSFAYHSEVIYFIKKTLAREKDEA
ncbi:MAG: hypothetical protein OEV42_06220 [Deltaproteobacteria bacterium]|nr:hypothetical protein [Deltaproteobacteria bacterium]